MEHSERIMQVQAVCGHRVEYLTLSIERTVWCPTCKQWRAVETEHQPEPHP